MPILTVTEYGYSQSDARFGGFLGVPHMRSIVTKQAIPISATSAPSAPFTFRTNFIRLNTDVACCLAYSMHSGEVPVAVDGLHRLSPDYTDYQGVIPGDMVAVIISSYTGGGGGTGGGVTWTPSFVLIDTSTGAQSYTLPAAPTEGEEVIVKDNGHAMINNITVSGGAYLIDGHTTFLIRNNWASYGFWFHSGQWYVV